jgi:hypothetical protein
MSTGISDSTIRKSTAFEFAKCRQTKFVAALILHNTNYQFFVCRPQVVMSYFGKVQMSHPSDL